MSHFTLPPLPSLIGILLLAAIAVATIHFVREHWPRR